MGEGARLVKCAPLRAGLVVATLGIAVLHGRAFAASWVQLSDGNAWSDVAPQPQLYGLSPDGRWAVYVQDAEVDGADELWSVPVFGGVARRICGLLPAGSAVDDFAFTPDSSTVVYVAPQDALGVDELFSAPIAGGPSIQLNGALVVGGDVLRFKLSPDGQRVVYSADQEANDRFELFSVSMDGGTPIKLNGALAAGGDVYYFAISPDGLHVVYEETNAAPALHSVAIAGGPATRLTGAVVAGGGFSYFEVTPDNLRVVYVADQQTEFVDELYSVPLLGGEVTKLNGALDPAYFVYLGFKISPNSLRVVFVTGTAAGGRNLYSALTGGGAATRLNVTPPAFGLVRTIRVTLDGQRVVYFGDQETLNVNELWSVPIAGGEVTKLNGPLAAGGDVDSFQLDGAWAVYVADQELDGFPTGHRVPIAGPAASGERIWYRAYAATNVDYAIDAPRDRVIVRGNEALVDGVERLWSFPFLGAPDPGGGEELVPRAAFDPAGDVERFVLTPDGTILYRGDQTSDEQFELYAVPALFFWDGFEGGDTAAWSAVAP